ncbi:RhoGEF domain-containing protein [Loa loa]|uniref:RhoGEF domain-containing protein n=1 Tax=Loa loa TaxID=7209 RepID=A0A1S0ULH5_LOALO|nr:RhoGEF domain-containing protein [Loa loa]EJD76560.1 RhoGEF domain-containing protein [Loa loa]
MDGEGSVLSSEVAASLLSLEVTENFTTDRENSVARSASQIRRVNRVCVVGVARNNAEVTDLLKNHFGIELLESEDGYEFTKDADITFLCSEFIDCRWFKYLNSCQKLIIGPAIIRKRAIDGKPLLVPRPNRPLYTDSMSGVRIALSGLSTKNCREAVDLVHFMGGSAQRVFSASTTHLITDAARGKTYRMAVSIGCRVMHLDWLRAAWAARDSIQIPVTTIDFMNQYMVEPFCGLSLWFVAYDEKDLSEMKEKTVENKGKVAVNQKQATHIVVSTSLDAKVEGCDAKQHLVSGEWFWISVQLNCCANENIYKWKGQRTKHNSMLSPNATELTSRAARKSVSKSSMEVLDSSNCSALPDYSEHLLSTDDPEILNGSPRRLDKRYAVCKEMLETEENYLRALKIVVQVFKEPLEVQLPNLDSGLLTKAEISQIFAKVPPLIDVHENICRTLQSYIMHWMNERLIGKVWLDHAAELTPVYKAFINNYDTAIQTLNECDQTKPKFHAFLKAAESRLECQRNSLPDLLVRPVQRLHSVVLLLKAILEKTDRKNPDHAYLIKAKRAVEAALTEANESRRQTDSYAMIFKLSSEIERCPADILSSARTLKTELHVLSLGGEDEWARTRNKRMAIFLFNDLIEIVKVRTGNDDSSTPTRRSFSNYSLTRQLSFSVLRHGKKKYKHHQQYMLASIRRIQSLEHADICGVFVLSFRVSHGEDFWVAQCLENQEGELEKFLRAVADQVYKLVGRNTLVEKVNFDEDPSSLGVKENIATIKKALNHAVRNPLGGYQALGTPRARPQNQFRRAMSTVHLGISNTLSRLHSRSNLRPIDESFERTSPDGRTHPAAFTVPSRGFRQILSTSTFLPSLGRRDSIFSHSIRE